ncbi:MAG: tetratricopeptide repeat protein [Chthoniobacteraceae bacterium]
MKSALAALAVVSSFVVDQSSFAQPPSLVTEAREALTADIPEVAIGKLRQALAGLPAGSTERPAAMTLLAEAQLNTGRAADALDTLAQITPGDDARTVRLRALSLVALARWDEAIVQFEKLAASETEKSAALAGKAECLQSLGRTQEAADTLKPLTLSKSAPVALRLRLAAMFVDLGNIAEARALLDSAPESPGDENWRRYIRARIHLHEKKPLAALDDLAPFIPKPDGVPPADVSQNLRAATTVAEADARLAASGPEIAEKVLEAFIRQNPASPQIASVFSRLDQIYALDRSTDEGPLTRMAAELPPPAAALAQFYLARINQRAKRTDAADAALKKFLAQFPDHSLAPYANAMLAESARARRDLPGAEAALDAASRTAQSDKLRGELALQTALLNLDQGEYIRASAGFLNAARRSPVLKVSARYDSALAWLLQKNYARFAEEFATFTQESSEAALAGNLKLEEGLTRAREGDVNARTTLKTFLADFKGHPRRAEAQLALAELALNDDRPAEAQKLAQGIAAAADTAPEMREHADYLGIFLADAQTPRNEDQAIARARDFIAKYPKSEVLDEVRMKLGEIQFRREDYLKAQEQFETLAREKPDGAHATAALFLAGQCSMKLLNTESLNHALELFAAVAAKHDALETHARLHQAIVKTKLGAPDDAVKIYDSILTAQPPAELELRLAALTGKADNLVTMGKTDAKNFTSASAAYDQVIATEGASPTWKNQAAYKKAKALEQQEQRDAALVILYDILKTSATGPRETFWFAKAGFDAAALVESRQQWKSAVGIYEKMAAIPGPHAEQARQRIRKLRLEHFLWD